MGFEMINLFKKNKDTKKSEKKDKNLITVVWLYPDILNNYGDRGNIEAIEYIAKKKNIETNIIKINTYDEEIPYDKADIILLGSGELRVMSKIIKRLEEDKDKIIEYINKNKYIFVFNLSSSIFAKETTRRSGEVIKGLSLLPLTVKEKRYNYGDDLDIKIYNGMNVVGTQIQMADYILDENSKYFGDVIYGYGNDFYSKKVGARNNNLIFPNIQGPLFFKNPWYLEFILNDILNDFKLSNDYIDNFNIDNYLEDYPFEVKALKAEKAFIKTKPSAPKSDYINEYLL